MGDPFTARDKVDVLLKEYDGLRAEIAARANHQFALLAFLGSVAAISVSQRTSLRTWIVLAVAVIIAAALLIMFNINIRRCARRIVQIERKINELVGEPLLEWETRWGVQALGYFKPSPEVSKAASQKPTST